MEYKAVVVDDKTGDPLAGASVVRLDDQDNPLPGGTQSGYDGAFSLFADPGDFFILVSHVGYNPVKIESAIMAHTPGGIIGLENGNGETLPEGSTTVKINRWLTMGAVGFLIYGLYQLTKKGKHV